MAPIIEIGNARIKPTTAGTTTYLLVPGWVKATCKLETSEPCNLKVLRDDGGTTLVYRFDNVVQEET